MLDTILITGGSRGIGAAAVREFARAGKRVAFTYLHSEKEALALADETGAFAVCCDVRDEKSVACAVSQARERTGDIEVLINNAGIAYHGLIADMSTDAWRDVFATNTDSTFYAVRACLPDMIARRRGRIINVSSVWGVTGAANEAAYSASKAAISGFTRAIAKEYASCGITVNAIAPGVVDTDMNSSFSGSEREAIIADIPTGRMAEPREIVYLMQFLASDRAAYITGQVIGIDGGFGQ